MTIRTCIGCSLATVDQQVARIRILWAFDLQMSCRLSLVLRLYCFRFFAFFIETVALRSIVLRYACMRADSHTQFSYLTPVRVIFVFVTLFYFILFLWRFRFSQVFLYHYHFSLCGGYVVRIFMVYFYLMPTGWIFDITSQRIM